MLPNENVITVSEGKYISSQWKATILVALSATLYGCLGYFGTGLMKEDFSVSTMLFWRFFIAAIWMLVFEFWNQEKSLMASLDRRGIYYVGLWLGAICYAGTSAFYFWACEETGTGLAMVIFFSYPMMLAGYAWLKNHFEMNIATFSSLIAILLGLILLRGNDEHAISLWGILLAILSGVFYAIYVFGSKKVVKKFVSSHFTIIICLSSAMIFLMTALATHSFIIPNTAKSWGYVFIVGIVATAIPIQLMFDGLKSISPLKASILSVLEPLVTIIIGLLLLDEAISFTQSIGILFLLSGAIAIQFVTE